MIFFQSLIISMLIVTSACIVAIVIEKGVGIVNWLVDTIGIEYMVMVIIAIFIFIIVYLTLTAYTCENNKRKKMRVEKEKDVI